MDNTKIQPDTREMRCQKCYRLHDLEWLNINNVMSVGYRCFFHKKAAQGFYYIKKFSVLKMYISTVIDIYGIIHEVKPSWYEVGPAVKKQTAIQNKFNFA